jgi:hypothetical protein
VATRSSGRLLTRFRECGFGQVCQTGNAAVSGKRAVEQSFGDALACGGKKVWPVAPRLPPVPEEDNPGLSTHLSAYGGADAPTVMAARLARLW